MRIIHYIRAPYKIVCSKPGDEIYFPSVSEFYYDWKDLFTELSKAKLYIGTDTGPTQLAALLETPMVLFRYAMAGNPNLIENIILPIAKQRNFAVQFIQDGWTQPDKVSSAAIQYLQR